VQAAREAARRADCTNRIRQLNLALQNYHSSQGEFPIGSINNSLTAQQIEDGICTTGEGTSGEGGFPWTVALLPYVEQNALFDQFDFDQEFTTTSNIQGSRINHALFLMELDLFKCPSDPVSQEGTNYITYFGVQGGGDGDTFVDGPACTSQAVKRMFFTNGVLLINRPIGIRQIEDGASNTFAIGETRYCDQSVMGGFCGWASAAKLNTWAMPTVMAGAREQINAFDIDVTERKALDFQSRAFGSYHPGGAHFGVADGSARFLPDSIDLVTLHRLSIRNDSASVAWP